MKKIVPWLAVTLTACTASHPPRDVSTQNRIAEEMQQAAQKRDKGAALPDSVSASLLPPLRQTLPRPSGKQLEQRFSLVVNDAPINQVLMSIVTDTPYSILLKPKSAPPTQPGANPAAAAATALNALAAPGDKVTVNLKDVTVFEALDALREIYGYDYTIEGKRIYVQPPELQTRLYQVNYIIGQRRGVSDLQVIGGASAGSNSGNSGTGTTTTTSTTSGTSNGSTGFASVQASALSTIAKSDIWAEVEDALRTSLGCQIPKNVAGRSGGTAGAGMPGVPGASGTSTGSSGGASRADVSFQGDMQTPERQRGVDGCTDGRALNINQMSGTIVVRGMPGELRLIEKLLRSMQLNIERQVIIEAKIIDVELNSESQQGINWAGFHQGQHRLSVGSNPNILSSTTSPGGTVTAGTTLGDLLGTTLLGTAAGSAFSAGLGMAVQARNFSALINFLETQGRVHVLSSPRISTLNNQKAVIKVGSEEPFVTSISGGSSTATTAGPITTPPTLNYQPFFSGISLDVTPQIDARDNITLHVHSLVNSILEKEKISLPSTNAPMVPFAVNTINETDSVVKTRDGQVVVIGGLMTETTEDTRSKIPGAGDVPAAGSLFRKGNQRSTKRELVLLLKPTVVKDDSAWANDIAETQARIERLDGGPAPRSE